MELGEDTLSIARVPSALDEAVMEFTAVLDALGVKYVIVSGYVVILTGRSRATEDVDVILEPLSDDRLDEMIEAFTDHGYYGMAMPFEEFPAMLRDGERVRIAEEGQLYPNFEVWFASTDIERTALEHALTAELDDQQIQISPIELQIAYKLQLAQRMRSTQGKDFEDALHLYLTFGERLNTKALERYVDELGVQEYYDKLEGL